MLTIRRAQMRVFERQAEARYLKRLAQYLASRFPERLRSETSGDVFEGALDFTRQAVARGRYHGLRTENELSRFAEVAIHLGLRMEVDGPDWVREVFEDAELTPGERIGYLHEQVLQRDLEATVGR